VILAGDYLYSMQNVSVSLLFEKTLITFCTTTSETYKLDGSIFLSLESVSFALSTPTVTSLVPSFDGGLLIEQK
jgi:hypothetical protein